jgi:probable H4MPT-linked C1 transfer pathway protein
MISKAPSRRTNRSGQHGPEPDAPQAPAGRIAGWDIGGVHLKGAVVEAGTVVDAFRIPAALWTGLDALEAAFDRALGRIGPVERHGVTLTGELSDLFEDRVHGVERLVAVAAARLGAIRVYAGRRGFLAAETAAGAAEVASANWHAAAAFVALRRRDALLIDIGSTTTDLVPVADGTVRAAGHTDAERLAAGELLYTGATRTPVMAVAKRVPFAGSWQPLVAEHFATMADVRRVTGELAPDLDLQDTADGRGKSPAESRGRLARMLGRDARDAAEDAWLALARYLGERQLAAVCDAAALVLSRGALRPEAPVVGAGIGRFLTRALSLRLGREHVDFEDLVPMRPDLRAPVAHAAPAVAVALLAEACEPERQGAEAASR